MSTGTQVRRAAASAARRAAEARAAARVRRRAQWVVVAAAMSVLAVAGVLVLVGTQSIDAKQPSVAAVRTPAPAALVAAVTGVPQSVIDAVGAGRLAINGSRPVSGGRLTGANGRPEVLYIGGEYCPFCAVERWAIVQALSRFGTFHNLSLTHSATGENLPPTPTFSFYGATYDSRYVDFVARELYTNRQSGRFYAPLEQLTPAEATLFQPYNSFPFLDVGGASVTTGATYDPSVLQGLSAEQIAASLGDATSPTGQAVMGAANRLTARICAVTRQQPAAVCTARGVRDAATG